MKYYLPQLYNYSTTKTTFPSNQPLSSPALIIYNSKMERFVCNNNTVVNNPTFTPYPESIQKVLFRLKDLREIQDQSRNELCPVSIDQQSSLKLRRDSNYSNQEAFTQVNILKQLEESVQKVSHVGGDCTVSTKRLPYNQNKDESLLLSNIKLKQDNMKLFSQCIKLRKMCQVYLTNIQQFKKQHHFQKQNNRQSSLERQLVSLRTQVQDLSSTNRKLEEKVKQLITEASSTSLVMSKCDKMAAECQYLQRQNSNLSKKVLNLEKQLELSSSRVDSKSISIYNSTESSKKSQVQKDRTISNMKIVHQSQVRRLKAMIQQLRKDSGKGEGQMGVGGVLKYR